MVSSLSDNYWLLMPYYSLQFIFLVNYQLTIIASQFYMYKGKRGLDQAISKPIKFMLHLFNFVVFYLDNL